jgi:integrase
MATSRRYGSGSLYARTDNAGHEAWYGHWRHQGRQVKRKIGPKRTPSQRDGLTAVQAGAELSRLMGEHRAAPMPAGERLDIAEVGKRYLRHIETECKRSTVAAVRGHLTHWHEPFFATKTLDKIRPEDVEDLMVLMRKGERPGGLRREKPLSPKTIRNVIGTLNALFRYAQTKRWATHNPVSEVRLPKVQENDDIRFLEPAEVEGVAAAAIVGPYQAIDRALYITAAMTGLRQGELVALRWRDVDWPAARVRVRQNHVLGEFGTPKSRRSTRSVPMADQVGAALDELFKASSAQGDDDLVFADPLVGGPLSKRTILQRYRKALKVARLDETHRFHDLRHTFGTRMAAAGVPMRTVQEWMGHRDIQTTQRYADYAPSAHEAAYIEAAFGQPVPARDIVKEPA